MNSPAATRDSNAKDYLAHVLCGYRHPKKVVVWVHEQAFFVRETYQTVTLTDEGRVR
jgi:hypothetical protein